MKWAITSHLLLFCVAPACQQTGLLRCLAKLKQLMDIEDFKKTEYFEWMLSQTDKMKQELTSFNQEYRGFIEGENKNLSVVLRSHLIIEYYMDRYIALAIPEVED